MGYMGSNAHHHSNHHLSTIQEMKKLWKLNPLIYFATAYASYPLMYAFENSRLGVNILFLFLFVGSSVLGFVTLIKK